MKIVSTFSGKEYIVSDYEVQNIIKIKNKGSKAMIELSCGTFIDSSSIETIGNPPQVAISSGGYVIHKGGYFIREGDRIYVEDWKGVRWENDPKYNIDETEDTKRIISKMDTECIQDVSTGMEIV